MERRTFLSLAGAGLLAGCGRRAPGPRNPGNLGVYSALPRPRVAAPVGGALQGLTQNYSDGRLWTSGNRWSRNAQDLYDTIATSWRDGLQPTSYLPDSMRRGLGQPSATHDLALSAAALKLVSDLRYGRTRSNFSGAIGTVARLRTARDVTNLLEDLLPQSRPYQRFRNLAVVTLQGDGVFTPGFASYETAMEKLRTQGHPNLDGRVVMVNIPAFDLHVYEDSLPALRSRVIVGAEGRQTPEGRDYITNLKFSPDWTPPRSIISRDLLPSLRANPAALAPLGMQISVDGRRIADHHSVDWNQISPGRVSMRQPPGPNAVLGGVRFSLNNSRAIYLHDTSARPLFDADLRTASSGCVRVQKSRELADWIMRRDGQPLSAQQLNNLMNQSAPVFRPLNRRVRVEMVYLTTWLDDVGRLTFYPDAYSREGALRAALRRG